MAIMESSLKYTSSTQHHLTLTNYIYKLNGYSFKLQYSSNQISPNPNKHSNKTIPTSDLPMPKPPMHFTFKTKEKASKQALSVQLHSRFS